MAQAKSWNEWKGEAYKECGRKEGGTACWLLADEASGVSITTDRQRGSQTSGDFDFGPGTGAMGGTSNQN